VRGPGGNTVVGPRGSVSNVYGGYYPYGAVAAGVAVGAAASYPYYGYSYPYPYYQQPCGPPYYTEPCPTYP
jgi:hypothetical protein